MPPPWTPQTLLQAAAEHTWRQVADEVVILQMPEGEMFGLNPTGAELWTLLQQPRTVDELVEHLVQRYDVERDTCRQEVTELLHELDARGLITAREP